MERRTVAATGIRPSITFRVNGSLMGSILKPAARFKVEVAHRFDMRPLAVMFIADGRLVCQKEVEEPNFEFTEEFDGGRMAECRSLYLKILYPDGNMAFASPVFFSDARTVSPSVPAAAETRTPNTDRPEYFPCKIRETECAEEFGSRIGRHSYVNASPLIPEQCEPMRRIRDMVVHTGPDALLVRKNDDIVAPTMDGIFIFDAGRKPMELHDFSGDPEFRLLISLIEIGDAVIARGIPGRKSRILDSVR